MFFFIQTSHCPMLFFFPPHSYSPSSFAFPPYPIGTKLETFSCDSSFAGFEVFFTIRRRAKQDSNSSNFHARRIIRPKANFVTRAGIQMAGVRLGQKQTCAAHKPMSAKCQRHLQATYCPGTGNRCGVLGFLKWPRYVP